MTGDDAAALPEPFTPSDCDLRDFPRMSLDIPRLFSSRFNAIASRNPLAWMVGLKLWSRSWHQVPAASLPNDDAELCYLAELGFGVETFQEIRSIAMHGWVLANDGRLYHPFVAEMALSAWLEKLSQQISSGAGNAKRWATQFDAAPLEIAIDASVEMLRALNPKAGAIVRASRRASQRHAAGSKK